MSDMIDWGKVGGRIFYAPVGSLDFKEVGTTIKRVNCLSAGETHSDFDPYTLELEVKIPKMDNDLLKVFGINMKVRLPRKTKKAIKKQCPGITPNEIRCLVSTAKIRRIKHRRI